MTCHIVISSVDINVVITYLDIVAQRVQESMCWCCFQQGIYHAYESTHDVMSQKIDLLKIS